MPDEMIDLVCRGCHASARVSVRDVQPLWDEGLLLICMRPKCGMVMERIQSDA